MHRICVIEDFISAQDIALAMSCFQEAIQNKTMKNYYDNPNVFIVPESDVVAISIIKKYSDRLLHNHKVLNGFAVPLYTCQAQLCWWPPGSSAGVHQDSHAAFEFIQFSSVLYLNNEYEGGMIGFPNQAYYYQPTLGSAVLFPSGGTEYMHGVSQITKGDRFTIAMFHTSDRQASLDAKYEANPDSPQAIAWRTHGPTSELTR